MLASQRSVSKVRCRANSKRPQLRRFVLISDGKVSRSFNKLSPAIEASRQDVGATVFSRMSGGRPTVKDKRRKEAYNPVADVLLNTLSYAVGTEIQATVDEALGKKESLADGVNSGGLAYGWPEEPRRKTNEECAFWPVDLGIEGAFDLRKPLPPQVAKWLRASAEKLIQAAAEVEKIDDDRNRQLIRKIVAEPNYLPEIIAQGVEFEPDGTISADTVETAAAKVGQKQGCEKAGAA